MIKKIFFVLLFLLLLYLSVFPRATEVIAHNFIFGFDQGRDFLAAKSIVVDHKMTLIGSEWGAGSAGLTGLFHGPGYFYLLSLAFLLFGGDPYGGVVVMLVLGLVTIAFSFYVGKKMFGVLGGYILALLVALSPPLIAQSRFFWNTYPSSPLILLVFYFIFRSTSKRRNVDLFLAAFFSGFIYNFQTGIAIPLALTFFLYSVLILRLRKLRQYLVLLAGYGLAFMPFILFEFRHNFQGARGLATYLFVHEKTDITPLFMQRMLSDHLGSFLYNLSDSFPKTSLPWWVIGVIIFFPVIYFWFKEKNSALRIFLVYLFCLPLVTFLVFSPLRNSVYPYYLYSLTFVYLFFFAFVFSRALNSRNPFVLSIYSVLLVWFLVVGVISAHFTYQSDVKDYGGDAKIKGKIDAIDYIYSDAKVRDFNLLVFAPPIYTYPYDYILWWHGNKKYGFVPGNVKKDTVYLLMEKDHAKPWSYNGWLETVVIDGRIEKTVTLPSGFIVQKRIIEE